MENHALFLSVATTVAGCGACAWGISPQLNAAIHLEPFPDDAFRWRIMGLVGASILGLVRVRVRVRVRVSLT